MTQLIRTLLTIMLMAVASAATAADGQWPRSVRHGAGKLVIEKKPLRVVSTSPSLTGILLAIDAPLVATAATTPSRLTDDKGFFRQWAEVADERAVEVLYSNLNFDMEAIIAIEPDVLIVSSTGADSVAQHVEELKAQGIPTLLVSYANQSWQDTATELGKALGLETEAASAIARFDAEVAKVAATIEAPQSPVAIVGYNVGGSYSLARTESAQAQLLQALGFKVSGLSEALQSQVTRRSDFEFISRENLPGAVETDTVFLLSATDDDVAAFLADPLLANRAAVQHRSVYPLGPTSFRIDYYSGLQMIEAVAAGLRKP